MYKSKLLALSNHLRGFMPAEDYHKVLIPLLFLQQISSVNLHPSYLAELEHTLSAPGLFDQFLPFVFPVVPPWVKPLLKELASVSPPINLGDAYEYLLNQFSTSSGFAGEFYTPSCLADLLSQLCLLELKTNKPLRVLDFACGSGNLLLNFATRHKAKLYGQELNRATYNLSRMNFLLSGYPFALRHGDSLREGVKFKRKFDLVLANPPFSYKWRAQDHAQDDPRFTLGLAPNSAADLAFVSIGLHHLKPQGVMGIILPHGPLFRRQEQHLRQRLVETKRLLAVIALPPKLFFAASLPVCLLLFGQGQDQVLFMDYQHLFVAGRKQNSISVKQQRHIIDQYKRRTGQLVDLEQLARHNFNLVPATYCVSFKQTQLVDLQQVHQQLLAINQQQQQLVHQHNQYLAELGLPPLF